MNTPLCCLLLLASSLFCQVSFAQEVTTLLTDSSRRFESLHWLPNNQIYSVDYTNGRVYEIFRDGTVETRLSGFTNLVGGGFDRENNFYVSSINTGEILKLEQGGTYSVVSSGFSQPISILQDANDADLFYVSEYQTSRLSTFSLSTGIRTPWLQGGGIFFPDGLIYDWNGQLLIASFEDHRISRIDTNDSVVPFADLGINDDMGYITIAGDHLYVPSLSSLKIYKVHADGSFEEFAGTGMVGRHDSTAMEASFRVPNGICSNPSGDTLLIGDFDRVRVITGFAPASVGAIEIEADLSINLFPNPATIELNVTLDEPGISHLEWRIADQSGKWVKEGKSIRNEANSFSIAIDDLQDGYYFFQTLNLSKEILPKQFLKRAD